MVVFGVDVGILVEYKKPTSFGLLRIILHIS